MPGQVVEEFRQQLSLSINNLWGCELISDVQELLQTLISFETPSSVQFNRYSTHV